MSIAVVRKIEAILHSPYDIKNYVDLVREIFPDMQMIAPEKFNKEFSNFSSHIEGSTHVGNYQTPDKKKIIIMAVRLKKAGYVENSRSTQRSYAKKLIENGNADAAFIAFYTEGDPKWRLSLVRLDYEMKIENGRLRTAENLTPAKRYSYLVGQDEPCHTAISQFEHFITDGVANPEHPTLDDLENTFSVEKVTDEFFQLYCEKFHQLREQLEAIEDFRIEAEQRSFTSAQFAKKLMGQIVFLYFLQKKGWLGVKAWPDTLTEKEYKNAFYARGAKSRELIPKVYRPTGDGTYHISTTGLNSISDADEEIIATCVKGKPWGSGPHNFMRRLFDFAVQEKVNFFNELLEPLFYDALNRNRGDQGYCPALHCRIPFLSGGLFEPIDGYDWEHNDFSIPNEVFSNAAEKGREADGILDIFDRYNFTMSEDEPMEREVAIDPEMLGKVFENLLEINDRKSKGAFYTPREIVHYMCQESLINYLTNALNVHEEAIRDFILYGDFMKDQDTEKTLRVADKTGKYHMEFDFERDLYISEEILSFKKGINRLRDLDNALRDVRIADPAVGSGAFLLGMLNEIVRARQNISAYLSITMKPYDVHMMYQMDRAPHALKKETIQNCIFACDIEPSAVDIAQLRLWLALVIDDEINPDAQTPLDGHKNPLPLPNLESNILCGNSLIDEFEGVRLIQESDLLGSTENYQKDLYSDRFDSITRKLIETQDELFSCNNTEEKKQLKEQIEGLRDLIILTQLEGCDPEKIQRYHKTKRMASKPYVLWQLDFTRVFKEKGGFDIVIGNPPYVQLSKEPNVSEEYKVFLRERYGTSGGRLNLYIFMIHFGIELLSTNGVISYIIPNTLLTQEYYKDTRKLILENHTLLGLVDYQDMPFDNAVVENITFFIGNEHTTDYKVKVSRGTKVAIEYDRSVDVSRFMSQQTYAFNIYSSDLIEGLFTNATPLGQLCNINQAIALKGDKSISVKDEFRPGYYRLLDGRNIGKYGISWSGAYLDYSLDRIHSCKRKDIFECKEKLFFRRVSANLMAAYDDEQFFALNTLVVITPKTADVNLKYILALFNSRLMNYIYKNKFKSTKTVFSEIQARSVAMLPIRVSEMQFATIVSLVDECIKQRKLDFKYDISDLECKIDRLVYSVYGLSEEDIAIIESTE